MSKPIHVAIVATPEVEPWVALGIHDAFWAVGVLWNRVMGEAEAPAFRPEIIAADAGALRTGTGAEIRPHATIADAGDVDLIFVPSLLAGSGAELGRENAAMLDWVRERQKAGARVVSSCTGSFLLAEAGLLDGREATTHWAFVEQMRKEYPNVRVRADRIIVAADEDGRIVTAGGATSWTDLVLYLVGRFVSEEEARRLARMSLFDWHHNGQNPYARLSARPQTSDAAIRAAQEWVALHYATPDIVTALAQHAQLPLKTFARRFKSATGFAPLDYVQRLRIEESKQALETSDVGVDELAALVGYQDAPTFRRLFKRMVGETPSEYRRRTRAPGFVRALPR
ncbi:MAG: helix-turn-helix domain-containing protein [Alphaproteobacteria bacterium]|nr:helix-turn-helix domain-containing protein [Alphaproteobacteria bacterium]